MNRTTRTKTCKATFHSVNKPEATRVCVSCNVEKPAFDFKLNASHSLPDGSKRRYRGDECYDCRNASRGLLESQRIKFLDVSPTDAAYLAGIIDGEGHIALTKAAKGTATFHLRVQISNTSETLIRHLQNKFGGLGYISKTITTRRIEPDQTRHPEIWKPRYDLIFVSTKAEAILRAVAPYIIAKTEQVATALEYQGLRCVGGRRISEELKQQRLAVVNKMRALTKRGQPGQLLLGL